MSPIILQFQERIIPFLQFVRNPHQPRYIERGIRKKRIDIFGYFLAIKFVVAISTTFIFVGLEHWGYIKPIESKPSPFEDSILLEFLALVLIGPICEEGIFRYWLGKYRYHRFFHWFYYISSLLFGYIHIGNFVLDSSQALFIPLLILPHTFGGFLYGYIRVVYGMWYAVGLHALFNFILTLLGYVEKLPLEIPT